MKPILVIAAFSLLFTLTSCFGVRKVEHVELKAVYAILLDKTQGRRWKDMGYEIVTIYHYRGDDGIDYDLEDDLGPTTILHVKR